MNEEEKWKLQHNHQILITDVSQDVIEELYSTGIINQRDLKEIRTRNLTEDKNELLLQILPTKGPNAYTQFREILVNHGGCEYLVERLDQTPHVHHAGPPASPTGVSHEDILTAIQKELAQRYEEQFHRINPLPWSGELLRRMPDVYTELLLNERDTYKRNQNSQPISVDDIFAPQEDSPPAKRVYIQGNSGSGKTVLCNKLAYDWAKRTLGPMGKFSLVLFLEMKEGIVKSNLKDTIVEHLFPIDFKYRQSVLSCLNDYQTNILLIIDGYDELSPLDKQSFESFLEGRYLHQVSCLVTSRPTNLEARHFDRRLTCSGFLPENARKFVDKYFNGKPKTYYKDLMDRVENSCYMSQLVENPLNCLLLCVHWEENEQNNKGNLPRSLSQLFFSIIDIMKWRHLYKTDQNRRGASKLEGVEDDNLLDEVKELAFNGVIEGCREVSLSRHQTSSLNFDVLIKMGILTKVESKLKRDERLCFTQRHIQEVLAAMHFPTLSGPDRIKYFKQFLAKPKTVILVIFIMGVFKTNDEVLEELFEILAENNRHNYESIIFELFNAASATSTSFNRVTKPFTVSFHALNEAESKNNEHFVSLIASSMPRNLFLDLTCLRNHFLCHDMSHSCFKTLTSMPCPERVMVMELSIFQGECLKLANKVLDVIRLVSSEDPKQFDFFVYCDGRNAHGYVSIAVFLYRLMESIKDHQNIRVFFKERIRSINFLLPNCKRLREMTSSELKDEMKLPSSPPVELPPLVVYTDKTFDELEDEFNTDSEHASPPEVAAFFFKKLNTEYDITWRRASFPTPLMHT